MERVTGIGGVFFKARDPAQLRAWYRDQLGIAAMEEWGVAFHWRELDRPERAGYTVWSPVAQDTRYFEPSAAPFMINLRVANLDRMLAQLRAAGEQVDEKVEASEFGRFGWFMDPEGNKVELWEPPDAAAGAAVGGEEK